MLRLQQQELSQQVYRNKIIATSLQQQDYRNKFTATRLSQQVYGDTIIATMLSQQGLSVIACLNILFYLEVHSGVKTVIGIKIPMKICEKLFYQGYWYTCFRQGYYSCLLPDSLICGIGCGIGITVFGLTCKKLSS